eukprot:sb/3476898/
MNLQLPRIRSTLITQLTSQEPTTIDPCGLLQERNMLSQILNFLHHFRRFDHPNNALFLKPEETVGSKYLAVSPPVTIVEIVKEIDGAVGRCPAEIGEFQPFKFSVILRAADSV